MGQVKALRRIDAACKQAGIAKQQAVMRWCFHHSALQPGDAIINGIRSTNPWFSIAKVWKLPLFCAFFNRKPGVWWDRRVNDRAAG
jgi:hypothetical protein